jgi:hypothetical protein
VREVIQDMYEFVLSLLLIVGGGYMLMHGVATELVSGVIGIVITYWFQKRSNESAINNLLRQSPITQPIDSKNVTPSQQVLECDSNPVKQP